MFAPGVGTAVPGGMTFREAHLAVELVAETGRLVGMDLVEVNPILDSENRTGQLAVQLALSAFGKRIWYRESDEQLRRDVVSGAGAILTFCPNFGMIPPW